MKSKINSCNILAPMCSTKLLMLLLLLLLLSTTQNEATRILSHDNEKNTVIWRTNEHLLLSSLQWRPVRPPIPNNGTGNPGSTSSSNLSSPPDIQQIG